MLLFTNCPCYLFCKPDSKEVEQTLCPDGSSDDYDSDDWEDENVDSDYCPSCEYDFDDEDVPRATLTDFTLRDGDQEKQKKGGT